MSIKEIALDLTVFTLSNVNDAISFKPQLCFEVPRQDYQQLKENYIGFTGTSIRKNRSKLFFLPTNVSDELQKLNSSVPETAKQVPNDGRVYYKNRLITELDYENVKRVETACAFIAYTALNSFVHFETDTKGNGTDSVAVVAGVSAPAGGNSSSSSSGVDIDGNSSSGTTAISNGGEDEDESEDVSSGESVAKALRKGNILGFRELGHLVGITPWHFHRVFKIITGLTIREYGQLCIEFIKKNRDLVNACRTRVEGFKLKEHYTCLNDTDFLRDGGLQYPATENVVLLNEYFIDPNKSKEFKQRKNNVKSVQEEVSYGVTQRSQIRKRRSSVMYGRMQRASQNTITSNSLSECLTSPNSRSISFPQSDEENGSNYNYNYNYNFNGLDGVTNPLSGGGSSTAGLENENENDTFNNYHYTNMASTSNFDNDTDESASASSDWERPAHNIFPPLSMATPRPTSPAMNSRKNSIISIGSAGAAASASNNKVSKKGGNPLEAHRRNRSDGLGINLDSLKEAGIDHKLSMASTRTSTAGASISGHNEQESNNNINGNNGTPAIQFNSKMFQNDDVEDIDFTNLDYNNLNNMFQKQHKLDPKSSHQSSSTSNNNIHNDQYAGNTATSRIGRSAGNGNTAALSSAFGSFTTPFNSNGIPSTAAGPGVPSMADISLFNNSLLEQTTTPATSLLLDIDPASASTDVQEELNVDTLLNNSSSLLDELIPFNVHSHHHHHNQPQRKDGSVVGDMFSMPEENELFDSINGDLLAGDALLSFEH